LGGGSDEEAQQLWTLNTKRSFDEATWLLNQRGFAWKPVLIFFTSRSDTYFSGNLLGSAIKSYRMPLVLLRKNDDFLKPMRFARRIDLIRGITR